MTARRAPQPPNLLAAAGCDRNSFGRNLYWRVRFALEAQGSRVPHERALRCAQVGVLALADRFRADQTAQHLGVGLRTVSRDRRILEEAL